MKNPLEFVITPQHNGSRLDRVLSELIPDSSRSFLQKLIKDGLVKIDSKVTTLPRAQVKSGMLLAVTMPEVPDTTPSAEPFEFDILYEDDSILVIDKPHGVVVHPAPGNHEGTVVNALLGRYPHMAENFPLSSTEARPGIVHRLDKDTSGCLVIAKTPEAQFKLGASFAEHTAKKSYLAICRGIPERNSGELVTLIGRHPVNRQKMAIVERNGKEAITSYRILAKNLVNNTPLALAKVNIATGRTHQIRVHMSSIKLPVLGDTVYGRHTAFANVTRQQLHAWKLALPHPVSGEMLEFISPLPEDMKQIAQLIVPQEKLETILKNC